ncbi:MAG: cupin domain-containing protein [Verrucomicrobia bacterium]|nr:MAG: cupin domain-containing protein [Verrucomicrobiota bacterium]
MKISRRDFVVAILTASATFVLTFLVFAQEQTPRRLASTVFAWDKLEAKTNAKGARREVFDSATATLDRFECHVTTINAGLSPHDPHRHPDEELIIVKEGTLEVTINGVSQKAGPGSVLFYASNDLHGMRNVGETPATYHVFRWTSPGKEGPRPK